MTVPVPPDVQWVPKEDIVPGPRFACRYLTAQAMTMGPSTTAHCKEEHTPAVHGPGSGPTHGSGGTRGSADTCQARVRHRLELERHAHAELVEHLLVFSLVGGLNAGAVLGWLWLL